MSCFADRVRARQDRISALQVIAGSFAYAGATFGLLYLGGVLQHLATGH